MQGLWAWAGPENLHLSEQAQNSDRPLLRLFFSSPASYSPSRRKQVTQRPLNKQDAGLKTLSITLLRSQDLGRTPPSCPASCVQAS